MPKRITQQQEATIVAQYQDGVPCHDIARQFDKEYAVSVLSIISVARRHGLNRDGLSIKPSEYIRNRREEYMPCKQPFLRGESADA